MHSVEIKKSGVFSCRQSQRRKWIGSFKIFSLNRVYNKYPFWRQGRKGTKTTIQKSLVAKLLHYRILFRLKSYEMTTFGRNKVISFSSGCGVVIIAILVFYFLAIWKKEKYTHHIMLLDISIFLSEPFHFSSFSSTIANFCCYINSFLDHSPRPCGP